MFIISGQQAAISDAIQARLGRGVTHLAGTGAFSKDSLEVLYTVVTRLELAKLRKK